MCHGPRTDAQAAIERRATLGTTLLVVDPNAAERAPDALVDALRLAQHRPGNARTVARLMHALNRFRRPRPETVMADAELRLVQAPALFVWGREDPYLSPDAARRSIERLGAGALRDVAGGHAPWLEDADACAELVLPHLAATGFAPRHER